jgi:hypothetical protein
MPYKLRNQRLEYLKKYYKKNKKKALKCAKQYYKKKSKNTDFLTVRRNRGRRYSQLLKMRVINHYCNNSPKCQCAGCPITHPSLLTLDHIVPIGDSLARRYQFGDRLYRWLIKKNFPKSFQILCASCNLAKGTKKFCPRLGKKH